MSKRDQPLDSENSIVLVNDKAYHCNKQYIVIAKGEIERRVLEKKRI